MTETFAAPLLDSRVRRDKTALRRYSCSRPIAVAMADGLVDRSTTVLDYGCGHGADVAFLKAKKIPARGWDPHHRPDAKVLRPADVVNLGYVLNVIENVAERQRTLRQASGLARKLLVVSVRVDRDLKGAREFGDGLLTVTGTFQKLYTQAEFLAYVEEVLEHRPIAAALGVAYVFKELDGERQHLTRRALFRQLEYRTDLIEEFASNRTARAFVALANSLGRTPLPEEFPRYATLLELFGSPTRIDRLVLSQVDRTAFEGSRERRREDILLYLAMLRLQGLPAPPPRSLPEWVHEDIKACWTSYASARDEAERFLFSLGRPEIVQSASDASSVGKRLPGELYVHRSAEEELPPLLRVLVFAAHQVVGQIDYDLVRLAVDGRTVAFLAYESFDEDPHPRIQYSVKIHLPSSRYDIHDYRDHLNPPILHRKDALVAKSNPHYREFRALTEQEEALDLLSAPGIGHRRQWEDLLASRQLTIRSHRIVTTAVEDPNRAS